MSQLSILSPVSISQNSETKSRKFEMRKTQSQILLNKVRDHIRQRQTSIQKLRLKKCGVDMKQIDNQIQFTHLDYLDQDADINHQRLIDQCVQDIITSNKPLDEDKPEDFSPMGKFSQRSYSQSKASHKRGIKKLPSTLIVAKLVKAKGIQKKTIQQQQQEKLDEFLSRRQYTESNHQKLPQINQHLEGSPRRLNIQTQRPQKKLTQSNYISFRAHQYVSNDPSPLFDKQSTISIVSDSFLDQSCRSPSPKKQRQEKTQIDRLIQQINDQKNQISTQQRYIRKSIMQLQQKYEQIDTKYQPEQKEKFIYLKYEQKIFGKGKIKQL